MVRVDVVLVVVALVLGEVVVVLVPVFELIPKSRLNNRSQSEGFFGLTSDVVVEIVEVADELAFALASLFSSGLKTT